MAKCPSCGKKLSFLDPGAGGLCSQCNLEETIGYQIEEKRGPGIRDRLEMDAAIEAIMLTTETHPEGLKIAQRIEIVTAECAFGMNMFKDLFAGVRDIVGGRSKAVQDTLRDSRRVALYELKKEAHQVGADAVVGVDLDYVELSTVGSMVMLVASGTAVKLAKD